MSENKTTRTNIRHLTPSQKIERHKEKQKACMRRCYLKNKDKIDTNNKKNYYEHREERLPQIKEYQSWSSNCRAEKPNNHVSKLNSIITQNYIIIETKMITFSFEFEMKPKRNNDTNKFTN